MSLGPAPPARDTCRTCRHFRNGAGFLEQSLPGFTTMSSAYAEVRLDDGLCALHDVLLRATATCPDHRAAPLV
jgi:hypothetical protein